MARLVELNWDAIPEDLTIQVGDVLRLSATGAVIEDGGDHVQLVGPLVFAAVGIDGSVLEPTALPGVALAIAQAPGAARLLVFRSTDLRPAQQRVVRLTILPASGR
jgi:hypothetical protein